MHALAFIIKVLGDIKINKLVVKNNGRQVNIQKFIKLPATRKYQIQ